MNFQYPSLIPVVVVTIFIFAFFYWRLEKKFFLWVEDHWFYRPRMMRICSSFFYVAGFALLFISLLDLRDRPIKVKNNIPQQRTVILIDTSSSMLVEDVQPNRLGKAIMLAKHFVKRAAGHAISVVLFSDFQKQIIPFTTDVDFLEARIGGLDQISLGRGSSNITAALQESLGYLKSEEDGHSQVIGNILIISDAEENQEMFALDIPNSVSIAMIAIGTNKGGPIPMRQSNGLFLGNKTYQGSEVISKVGEDLLKNLADKIKNYKYWVVQSFSMPTEDILRFFSTTHKNKFSQGQSTIKVPRVEYLLIPGLASLVIAFALRLLPSFSMNVALVMLTFFFSVSGRTSTEANNDKKEDSVSLLVEELENKIKNGESDDRDRLKLAELYLRDKERKSEALTLFEESRASGDWKTLDPVDLSNYATALFENGEYEKGFEVSSHLFSKDVDPKLQEVARQNVLLALQSQSSDEQKKQDDKQKKSQEQKDDKNGQQQKESNDGKGEKQDSESGESQEENSQEKSEGKQSNKDNAEKGKGEQEKEKEKAQDGDEKSQEEKELAEQERSQGEKSKQEQQKEQSEKQMSPHMAKKMMNAQLKQLLEGDRQLQERFMNTSTTDKAKSQGVKDW